jgi:hypothetical protein
VRRIIIARAKTAPQAACADCTGVRPDATRERVRLHVEITGHTAHVVINDITTYTRKASE